MEPLDLLRCMVSAREGMRLRYFVTGSTATIFYGEPQFTNDIDVVVNLQESQLAEFCSKFPADKFYLSEHAARDAVRTRSQFNIRCDREEVGLLPTGGIGKASPRYRRHSQNEPRATRHGVHSTLDSTDGTQRCMDCRPGSSEMTRAVPWRSTQMPSRRVVGDNR
jgi:hypothetical protein